MAGAHPVDAVLAQERADLERLIAECDAGFKKADPQVTKARKAFDKIAGNPDKPLTAAGTKAWKAYESALKTALYWHDAGAAAREKLARFKNPAYIERRQNEYDRRNRAKPERSPDTPDTPTNTKPGGTKMPAKTTTKKAPAAKLDDKTKAAMIKAAESSDSMPEAAEKLNKAGVLNPKGGKKWDGPMVYRGYHGAVSQAQFAKTRAKQKAAKKGSTQKSTTARKTAPTASAKKKSTAKKSTTTPKRTGVQVVAPKMGDLAKVPAKPDPKTKAKTAKRGSVKRSSRSVKRTATSRKRK